MSTDFFLSFFIWAELLHETFMGKRSPLPRSPLRLNVMTPRGRGLRITFVLMALCSFGLGEIKGLSKSIFAVTVLQRGDGRRDSLLLRCVGYYTCGHSEGLIQSAASATSIKFKFCLNYFYIHSS